MKTKRIVTLIAALLTVTAALAEEPGHERPFVDFSRADNFLELRAYALGGGSTVTQNYISCFPQITELNVSMGTAAGLGAGAQFVFTDFLSLGTELNFLVNDYSVDLAIMGANMSSVSSVFLKNRFYALDIPVFMSARFNVSNGVRWNVDGGMFYSYGLGGHQKQHIYDSRINDLGQLVMQVDRTETDFYNDAAAFIHSSKRGDIGLHLATGLTFGRHLFIGLRTQIGFKNVAKTDGITVPSVHNFNVLVQAGYKF